MARKRHSESSVNDVSWIFDKYATKEVKGLLPLNNLKSTIHEYDEPVDGGRMRRASMVQYIGLTIEWQSNSKLNILKPAKKFMEVVNWGVKEGHLKHGTLGPMMLMNLAGVGANGEMIDRETGRICKIGPYEPSNAGDVYEGAYIKRAILLLYPATNTIEGKTMTKEELNLKIIDRFNIPTNPFIGEGQIPSWTHKQ